MEGIHFKHPAVRILLALLVVLPPVVYVATLQAVWSSPALREETLVVNDFGRDVLFAFGVIYGSWALALVLFRIAARPGWARPAILALLGAAVPAWAAVDTYARITAVRCGGERVVLQHVWPRAETALGGAEIDLAGVTKEDKTTRSDAGRKDSWIVHLRDAGGRELLLGRFETYDAARYARDRLIEQQYRARVESAATADSERTVELNGLGHVLQRLGRPWEAHGTFERALAAGAAGAIRSESLVGLARIERKSGAFDRAAEFYKQALEARRGSVDEPDPVGAVLAGEYESLLREMKKTKAADAVRREYGPPPAAGLIELGLGKEEAERRRDFMRKNASGAAQAP